MRALVDFLPFHNFMNDAVEQCYFGQSSLVKTSKVAGSSPAIL
jgi:hypothetical protein